MARRGAVGNARESPEVSAQHGVDKRRTPCVVSAQQSRPATTTIGIQSCVEQGVVEIHRNDVRQARQESNLQPPVLETGALPIELRT